MPKLTLLEITQDVLNDLDSDPVNSIYDTQESDQIANIAKSVYYEMLARREYPHLHRLLDLDPSNDVTKPTHMKLLTEVQTFGVMHYNKQEQPTDKVEYVPIERLRPEEFLYKTNQRNSTEDNVDVIKDWANIDLLIRNDKFPEYYTTFDDEWLVFDSYNKEFESTLQASNVQAFGNVEPAWSMDDAFVPDFPSQHFPTYVAEIKSVAFLVLKQMASQKHEQQSARGQRWLARQGRKVKHGINYPDMGRKGKLSATRHHNPLFSKDA
jgi:hypothetical protein